MSRSRSAGDLAAQPSRALTEEMIKPHSRQLGYVAVTRPVRQGRLKLALEEVRRAGRPGWPGHALAWRYGTSTAL